MESRSMTDGTGSWSKRFIWTAIIQGGIVVGLTAVIVVGQAYFLKPEISRVIASGGAGTWFTFGYLIYISVGIIAVAVSAVFYHLLGTRSGSKIFGALAWAHLILMNVGISAAAGLMMYAGYIGGAAALPEAVGGEGLNPGQVHGLIAPFVEPIAVAILLILAGVISGGIGFVLAYKQNHEQEDDRNHHSRVK